MKKTSSTLVIINQTRDNIGKEAMFKPKTRPGGKALTFYADIEIWTRVKTKLKKTVRKRPRFVGTMVKCDIKRSRKTGRRSIIDVPIYYGHGIDDVGCMIDYLLYEKHWKGDKSIKADDYEFTGTKEALIRHIEQEELELDLACLVESVWQEIRDKSQIQRKPRYR